MGADIVQMYEIAEETDGPMSDIIRDFVTEAYERPRFNGQDLQQRQISEFKSDVMVQCVRELPEDD
jgi:hypothetical protein